MSDTNKSEPATKADLKELALTTKNDLVAGLAGLRTELKTDLKELEQRLSIELAKTQADVREIKHDIATKMSTKDDISRVMSAIDAFAAEALSYRNRDALRGDKITTHDEQLENHENRITLLETRK